MDNKEKIKNIWAMADKPIIDIMTKKPQRLSATLYNEYSSDETSDSDLDRNSDFIALPEEFRPNLNMHKPNLSDKRKNVKISPTQTLRKQYIQTSISDDRKPRENVHLKKSFDEYPKPLLSTCRPNSPLQNNPQLEFSSKEDVSKRKTNNSRINFQTVKNTITPDNIEKTNEVSKRDAKVEINTSQKFLSSVENNGLLSQSSTLQLPYKSKKKKSLKYEYVQKLESSTIKMNFDILSIKDTDSTTENGLKYETKLAQNAPIKLNDSFHADNKIIKRSLRNSGRRINMHEKEFPVSFQQSNIKWDSSLRLKSEKGGKIKWNYVHEENIVLTSTGSVADDCRQFDNDSIKKRSNSKCNRTENLRKIIYNNSWKKEIMDNQFSKSKITSQRRAKNVKSRSMDNKLSSENFSYKNNLNSEKYTIKNSHTCTHDLSVTEFRDSRGSYVKESNIRKHNVENALSRSSSSETLDLSRPFQKPSNDFMQAGGLSQAQIVNLDAKTCRDIEDKRDSILRYGKEISDLIIGSYISLSMLISFYREWTIARRKLIFLFEQLEKNLTESLRKFSKYADIIKLAKSGSDIAANIPHPAVAMAAKIVSIITGLLQTLLKSSKANQVNNDHSDEITKVMFKDTQATSELHMYVLQCSQQFEETTQLIKEFHSNADVQLFFDNENTEITTFIRGFLEYKPDHRIFYKKLHNCFRELLQTCTTPFSRRFCEPFMLYSSPAIDVIEYLSWRFRYEDFDGLSVCHELQEIHLLIQNSNTTGIEDLQKRIQNCIRILTEELEFREKCMNAILLFDTSAFSK